MEEEWFVYTNDHHIGPLSLNKLKEMLEKGEVKKDIPIWKPGVEGWVFIGDVINEMKRVEKNNTDYSFDDYPPPLPNDTPHPYQMNYLRRMAIYF